MCGLLVKCGCKVDSFTMGGDTALLLATRNGHFECVEMLAKYGANVNTKDRSRGWCALIWCAFNGHVETLEILLRAGANREMKAETKFGEVRRGMKALLVAEVVGNSQVADFLRTWDDVVAKEGALALELQNESDERNEMFEADEESYAVEMAIKAAEEEAERIRIEEEKQRLRELEEQRLYEIDLLLLEEERSEMQTRILEAKEAEDWDLFELLEEQFEMLPSTVEEYRERIALKLIAEQQREASECALMEAEETQQRAFAVEEAKAKENPDVTLTNPDGSPVAPDSNTDGSPVAPDSNTDGSPVAPDSNTDGSPVAPDSKIDGSPVAD